MQIKAILWDYGNVLVDWSPRHLYGQIITDPQKLDYFLEHVCTMKWHGLHDAGAISMRDNINRTQKLYPEFHDEIAVWQSRFGEMIKGSIDETIAMVEHFHQKAVPQFVLTNMPEEVVDTCFDPYNIRHKFNDIIVSGIEKMAKPGADIFYLSLKRMEKYSPQEVLFIDDSLPNIETAAKLGFITHHYKNDGTLSQIINEIGL